MSVEESYTSQCFSSSIFSQEDWNCRNLRALSSVTDERDVDAGDQTSSTEDIKDVSSLKPVIIPVGLFPLTSSEGTLFMFHEKVIKKNKNISQYDTVYAQGQSNTMQDTII